MPSKNHEKIETKSKNILKRISENSSGLEKEKSESRPSSKRSISEISRKRVSSNFVVEKHEIENLSVHNEKNIDAFSLEDNASSFSEIASYHLSEGINLENFPNTNDISNVEINAEMSDLHSIKEDVNMFPAIEMTFETNLSDTNPLNMAFILSQSDISAQNLQSPMSTLAISADQNVTLTDEINKYCDIFQK